MKIPKIQMAIIFTFTISIIAFATNPANAESQIILQEGSLITNPTTNKIYILKSENNIIFRREILDSRVLNSYPHLSANNVIPVNDYTFNQFTPSNLLIEVDYRNVPVNGKIYALSITSGSPVINKHHLNITPYEFEQLGLQWGAIYPVNSLEASLYQEGPAMNAYMVASYLILPNQKQQTNTTYTQQQVYSHKTNYTYGYTIQQNQPRANIQPNYQTTYSPSIYQNTQPQPVLNSATIQETGGYATYNAQNNSVTIYEEPGYQNTTYVNNPYLGSIPKPATTSSAKTKTTAKIKNTRSNKKSYQISTLTRSIPNIYKRENTTSSNLTLRNNVIAINRNVSPTTPTQTTQPTATQPTTQQRHNDYEIIKFFLGVAELENKNN